MRIGRLYGIDVHIHWSFWLLILFYLVIVAKSGGLIEGLTAVTFVLAAFFCVLLHEYGHALAARRYGIRTHDITLMPIGGVARLERIPEKPIQEFVVAIAGPLVNVAIAGILAVPVALDISSGWVAPTVEVGGSFLSQLMAVNLFLVLFNMLPAFPMDGGRVLRSLLAMRVGVVRATEIAARLGRWMALAFAVWGIFVSWNPMLVLLAAFVFITGTMELFQVRLRSLQSQAAGPFDSGSQWEPAGWQEEYSEPRNHHPEKQNSDVIDAIDFRQIR